MEEASVTCVVDLDIHACGHVVVSVGPIQPWDLIETLRYLGTSEMVHNMLLDACAEKLAEHAMENLDEE